MSLKKCSDEAAEDICGCRHSEPQNLKSKTL